MASNVTDNTFVDCPICFESIDSTEMITFCENNHNSCKSCYIIWKTKCLDTHREITCPCCRNMTLSCLACREDFPIEELKRPCVLKNHYYCNDCLVHRVRRCSYAKLDTPCIVCRNTIYKYIHGTYGPKLPQQMLKYSDKMIQKMREKNMII